MVEIDVLTERQQDEKIGGQFIRIAKSGDTLYAIAFEAGLDVNKVAAWNGIQDTSKLFAGQRVRLTKPVGFVYPEKTKKPTNSAANNKSVNSSVSSNASARTANKAVVNVPVDVNGQRKPSSNTSLADGRLKKPTIEPELLNKELIWRWPVKGAVVSRFNPAKGQKGIDIQGKKGQAIRAAEAGEVVYAGNSLKGYGNLVIVKHSDDFLSAYANNQTVLVREGQFIKQAQVLALLGENASGKVVSQFQIRKNGNPVNPLPLLN